MPERGRGGGGADNVAAAGSSAADVLAGLVAVVGVVEVDPAVDAADAPGFSAAVAGAVADEGDAAPAGANGAEAAGGATPAAGDAGTGFALVAAAGADVFRGASSRSPKIRSNNPRTASMGEAPFASCAPAPSLAGTPCAAHNAAPPKRKQAKTARAEAATARVAAATRRCHQRAIRRTTKQAKSKPMAALPRRLPLPGHYMWSPHPSETFPTSPCAPSTHCAAPT